MQLAKVQLARAIWLFDTGEMNPYGNSILPSLVSALVQQYQFQKFPNVNEVSKLNSLRFENGEFALDERQYDVSLEIFNDGITADSRHSTSISDIFLFDVIKWACNKFNLTFTQKMARKRAYRSELILHGDRSLSGLCEIFDRMAMAVSDVAGMPSELTAITFGSESKLSLFSLERKINEPLEDLKFYSSAQMETVQHMRLLNALGSIISPGAPDLLGEASKAEEPSDLTNSQTNPVPEPAAGE